MIAGNQLFYWLQVMRTAHTLTISNLSRLLQPCASIFPWSVRSCKSSDANIAGKGMQRLILVLLQYLFDRFQAELRLSGPWPG